MHWREWAFPLHRSVLWVHVAFSPAAAQENARGSALTRFAESSDLAERADRST
jgi:hypothetical protein